MAVFVMHAAGVPHPPPFSNIAGSLRFPAGTKHPPDKPRAAAQAVQLFHGGTPNIREADCGLLCFLRDSGSLGAGAAR